MSNVVADPSALNTDEEVRGWEERRAPWLVEAHKQAISPWYQRFIPLDRLGVYRVDEHPDGYQRPVKEGRVQHIIANFDSAAARDLYVSRRPDGSLWLIDGQHTAEALRRLGFSAWPCRVFTGLSVSREAEWFDALNNNTQRIPSVVDHNAKVLSGREPSIIIDEVLDKFYLRIASARIRDKEGSIPFSSASMFEQILRMGGESLLTEVLQLCVDAWGHRKSSFMSRVMTGIAYLLAWNEVPLDRGRMLAVLSNTTPNQIADSLGSTGTGGGPSKCARALVELYNAGFPSNGYPKIRANSAEAPKLPDRKIGRGEGSTHHDYWTDETKEMGRKTVGPFVPPAKPSAAERRAEEVSSGVEEIMGDVTAPTTSEAPSAPSEAPEEPGGSDGSEIVSIPAETAQEVNEAAQELAQEAPVSEPSEPLSEESIPEPPVAEAQPVVDDDEEWEMID